MSNFGDFISVSSTGEPCSGGWPILAHDQFCFEKRPEVIIHHSYYSGRDVTPMSSVWIEKGGKKVWVSPLPWNNVRRIENYRLEYELENYLNTESERSEP